MLVKINDNDTINLDKMAHYETGTIDINGSPTNTLTILSPMKGPILLIGDDADKMSTLLAQQPNYTVLADVVVP